MFSATKYPIPNIVEPLCASHAIKYTYWKAVMKDELAALYKNSTWILVPPPHNRTIIGYKWVFRVKQNPDGTISIYKAILVPKCFDQRPSLDYSQTLNPVVKPVTIRLVLSLAISRGWSLHQIDVNNGFLQGDLA